MNLSEFIYKAECGHNISLGYINDIFKKCLFEYFKINGYPKFCKDCNIKNYEEEQSNRLRFLWKKNFYSGRCCDKAEKVGGNCVCSYETNCPDHGRRCNGSHD